MDEFLLIDTSTPIIQCGTVNSEGKTTVAMRGSGDVVEVLPDFVGQICKSGFDDKLGIVYCHGPGSTLGLRSALMAINVWIRFCGKKLKLYSYSSLSMAKYLANGEVIACGSSGKFVAETPDGKIETVGTLDGFGEFCFLNTRRIVPTAARNMRLVDYDLGKFGGDVFSISHETEIPDLCAAGKRQFLKWSGTRHRAPNI
ncbi:MAG: hypothetical protein LBD33_00120 [Puniceicoccales bacterium]|jgi:hypothetical protein|nr:hypothetical protein [Puniceicoccales bacterium]